MIPEGLAGRQGNLGTLELPPQDEVELVPALPESAKVLRDPSWVRTFCGLIANGTPLAAAARLNDLDPKMVNHWLERGRAEKAPEYVSFHREVAKARAYIESKMLTAIVVAANNGDWRAADRMLQVSHPEDYAPQGRMTIGGDPEAPLKIELSFPAGIVSDNPDDVIDVTQPREIEQ